MILKWTFKLGFERQSQERFEFAIRPARNLAGLANFDLHTAHALDKCANQGRFGEAGAARSRHNLNQQVVAGILNYLSLHDREIALEHRIEPANPAAIRGDHHVVNPAFDELENR